jgi:hypothetical protein
VGADPPAILIVPDSTNAQGWRSTTILSPRLDRGLLVAAGERPRRQSSSLSVSSASGEAENRWPSCVLSASMGVDDGADDDEDDARNSFTH